MAETLQDLVGWPVIHQFFRIDRARWQGWSAEVRRAATEEFRDHLTGVAAEEGLQFVPMAGIAKADFGYMAIHPELGRIQQLGQELAATTFGTCLTPVYAFLSMSEVSEYTSGPDDWAKQLRDEQHLDPASPEFAKGMATMATRMKAYAEARVYPKLPKDMSIVCFYPMSKARGEQRNWYALPFEERKKLMSGHGTTGRKFAGRVLQLITSSTGLDDWEWGDHLRSRPEEHPRCRLRDALDEGSALYGLFGECYLCMRIQPDELQSALKL
jgi:chlorite dismutase